MSDSAGGTPLETKFLIVLALGLGFFCVALLLEGGIHNLEWGVRDVRRRLDLLEKIHKIDAPPPPKHPPTHEEETK